jgi:hypothetical protein
MLNPVDCLPAENVPPPKLSPPDQAPGPPLAEPPTKPPHPNGPQFNADLLRVLHLMRVLWPCGFPVGLLSAGLAMLLGLSRHERRCCRSRWAAPGPPRWLWPSGFFLLLSRSTSRLLLDRRFMPDSLGEYTHPRIAEGLRRRLRHCKPEEDRAAQGRAAPAGG